MAFRSREVFNILKFIDNKRGSSYIGLVATLFVAIALVVIVSNFSVYISSHKDKVYRHNDLSEEVLSKLAEVNNADSWETLTNESVITDYGAMIISYDFKGVTEFETNKLNVTFELNEELETYSLERSVYYE